MALKIDLYIFTKNILSLYKIYVKYNLLFSIDFEVMFLTGFVRFILSPVRTNSV